MDFISRHVCTNGGEVSALFLPSNYLNDDLSSDRAEHAALNDVKYSVDTQQSYRTMHKTLQESYI